ncbi:hypothetical protein PDJ90_07890, partial [Bacillus cereus]|nr:hypothetical protein [Bacillus cereus]
CNRSRPRFIYAGAIRTTPVSYKKTMRKERNKKAPVTRKTDGLQSLFSLFIMRIKKRYIR